MINNFNIKYGGWWYEKKSVYASWHIIDFNCYESCSSNSKSTTNENETTIIQAEYPVYDTAEEMLMLQI